MLFHSTRLTAVLTGLLFAIAGCGKSDPPKTDAGKPAVPGAAPATVLLGAATGPTTAPSPQASPAVLQPNDPSQVAAEKFVKDLGAAGASPEPLPAELLAGFSPAFLKVIGKPVLSSAEKAQGYSAGAAEAWIRRTGGTLTGIIQIPTGYGDPSAAVFAGTVHGTGFDGRFSMRLIRADSGWKLDWFEFGSAKTNDIPAASSPDGPFQDFAVLAFLDAVTGTAVAKEDRMLLLGAILSPRLRTAWGEPFAQDKDRGYDFSPGGLAGVADGFSDPNGRYTRTSTGPGEFKVELTKSGTVKAWRLKLIKGSGAGEWLVDEFAPQ